MVGTAGMTVGLYFCTAFNTSVKGGFPARGSGIQSNLLPVPQADNMAQVRPKLWYQGRTPRYV